MSRRSTSAGRGDCKMVIVVRGELRLTPGKAAVQVAHAAVLLALEAQKRAPEEFRAWSAGGQKKIAVVASTLDELEALAREARRRGLLWVLVEDAGFTEVPPGTKTCLGIGPSFASDVDPVTGNLPLL
ncbi:MAG TPA: peptidyl-tRNA hydrolase Pth2 [Thermoplasmata archaeon]|nr:peptidyl-tRNA hydrolase Pth2 [Thermoplasmata archaeon]